jgi:hypothetical protein
MIPHRLSDLLFWIGVTCGIASIAAMLGVLASLLI